MAKWTPGLNLPQIEAESSNLIDKLNLMRRNFTFLLSFLACQSLMAQDLHVYYNAYSDSVYYAQNGMPVSRPQVRKGQQVILHIENFNNYLYGVTIKTEQSRQSLMPFKAFDPGSLSQPEAFDPFNLIFGGIGGGGIGIPGLSLGDDQSGFAGDTKAEQEQQALFKELRQLETTFRKTQEVLNVLDDDISNVQKKMQTAVESRQIKAIASDAIGRIKYNPHLEPRQIKELSLEYMAHVFGDATDPQKLSVSELFKQITAGESLAALRQENEKNLNLYAAKLDQLKVSSIALQHPKFDFEGNDLDPFRAATQKVVTNTEKNLQTYRANAVMFDTAVSNVQKLDLNTLLDLRTDYIVLKENDFSHVSRHKMDGDKLDLRITFTPIDSVRITGVSTRQVAPIEVIAYGGLQIKGGLGLSFGGFFERPGDYFVRDSSIHSSSKGAFSPILTSFVHFYSPGRNATSIGGSFGVGIPIGGGRGLESLTFFLGPSLIVGSSQGVVISTGLMGGQVSQLSGGYAIGDRFEADAGLLPTEAVYKLGYFLGISFNLIGK